MTTVFIDGLGLIGASLATFIKEKNSSIRLLANDPNNENLNYMREQGLLDKACSFEEGAKQADIIILASPVAVICQRLSELAELPLKEDVLVSDVGSSKVQIEQSAQPLMAKGVAFLAGHPMAGSHLTGAKNVDTSRLVNHTYFLIQENCNQEQVAQFEDLLAAAHFDFRLVNAKSHDQIVAASSHLPHMVAFALASTVNQAREASTVDWGKPAAGFLDATRIAKADATMWTSIFLSNPKQILAELDDFEKELSRLKQAIENKNATELFDDLKAAQTARLQMEKE
ncbi:prephenate dehydrogenase [Fructobacillus fructosus]|uniref:Prephenate dehydrogenase (TyrA) n=1 Tax=Fructobacillus fructosus TaxID=1631 RepID=A0ABN9YR20_9LACO|nr:prephenate dehydrogenase/arogenate dehydrogenase family protein [Fructobacillus fructosus]MBC9118990.1 prephenate dehydrogenase/arogenate dehydrogenase family protein [Fructobacillus fructosus]MBD9365782.1 prephenate dehydrogenase/arogenate dehydrogenase family protein [Leuconostoc mesenteroides]MCK8638567.1 prephenate dehydrogenase/arogenate dehydrogenase family protein [Fructobacillus fructosus]CAK1238830.1 Prephenate dehydrogenase (TyrA) [Fructobacillus fructosus]